MSPAINVTCYKCHYYLQLIVLLVLLFLRNCYCYYYSLLLLLITCNGGADTLPLFAFFSFIPLEKKITETRLIARRRMRARSRTYP